MLLDCFRPGTCERLGIGPQDCEQVNPRLIFARMTGWGQDGPLATTAGHDINYLSQTGVLNAIGYRDRPPVAPLNLVADFGGGSMLVLLGIVAALYERETLRPGPGDRRRDGRRGQRAGAGDVDVEVDGRLADERESFLLDGSAPYYRTYETADGKYMAVGSIEPQFFAQLLAGLGLAADEVPAQSDKARTRRCSGSSPSASRARPATSGRRSSPAPTRASRRCSAGPRPPPSEHLRARRTIVDVGGTPQAAPAPRFSRTPAGPIGTPPQERHTARRNRLVDKVISANLTAPAAAWIDWRLWR